MTIEFPFLMPVVIVNLMMGNADKPRIQLALTLKILSRPEGTYEYILDDVFCCCLVASDAVENKRIEAVEIVNIQCFDRFRITGLQPFYQFAFVGTDD